jgi:ABC-type Mn2+/Zn2+ transport system ATPase subunit
MEMTAAAGQSANAERDTGAEPARDHVCWGGGPGLNHHHVLSVRGVTVGYREVLAVEDVSFETECGRGIALLGPNGAGKSTLLKALAGLLKPRCGEILWRGRRMTQSSHELAYLPQRGEVDWSFPVTVRGLVEMGRYPSLGWWRRFSSHDQAMVDRALAAMRLEDLQDRQISALSGGQQQRAFIARALAQEAHVLLLDEPFAGLDKPAQESLAHLFRELAAEGRLLIASHHDLATVGEIFDEALILRRRLLAAGPVDRVCTASQITDAFDPDTHRMEGGAA